MHTTDPDQPASNLDQQNPPPYDASDPAEPIDTRVDVPAAAPGPETPYTSGWRDAEPTSWTDEPAPTLEPESPAAQPWRGPDPMPWLDEPTSAAEPSNILPHISSALPPDDTPTAPSRAIAPHPAYPTRILLVAVGALIVLALLGLGAVKLRGALTPPPAPTPVASQTAATSVGTATAAPTMPNFSVPNGKLGFGYGGSTNSAQTCAGTVALPPLTITLGNSGNVAVDWWVQVKQMLPDGKTLWTGTAPPYNTLPAGQSAQLQLQPDRSLCGQLIGHSGSVQYSATVFYAGQGAFTITDTITPPPPGTSTPTPTVPLSP